MRLQLTEGDAVAVRLFSNAAGVVCPPDFPDRGSAGVLPVTIVVKAGDVIEVRADSAPHLPQRERWAEPAQPAPPA